MHDLTVGRGPVPRHAFSFRAPVVRDRLIPNGPVPHHACSFRAPVVRGPVPPYALIASEDGRFAGDRPPRYGRVEINSRLNFLWIDSKAIQFSFRRTSIASFFRYGGNLFLFHSLTLLTRRVVSLCHKIGGLQKNCFSRKGTANVVSFLIELRSSKSEISIDVLPSNLRVTFILTLIGLTQSSTA